MEAKTCICLCALLLFHLGAADHDEDHAAHTVPPPDLDHHSSAADTTTWPTGRSLDASARLETSTATPQAHKGNATNVEVTSVSSVPEKGSNLTDDNTSNSSVPVVPASVAPEASATILAAHTDATTTSAHQPPLEPLPISITPPTQTTPNSQTLSSTSIAVATTLSTTTTPTTTTTTTHSTAATHSSRETFPSQPTTTPSPPTSSWSYPETSSQAPQQTTTMVPPQQTTTQTKPHPDTPSQLNVKGETVMIHDSHTPDPLLAGLVSAFVITAVIITLLLFLKLRRRDNRPEFRRLQDLPMDDMMEETPLSMYSY
ncbi:uncharacterized protein LOC133543526 [Nerophis ophidion]|uniref:uncharacterized protein LOC133543526 n=1 Tax=Nerophis ophidion TaxID=159077 RepID=UPI002ADF2761|nr:uncharacterized protein LOC133543526 [Nerophis ophidion]